MSAPNNARSISQSVKDVPDAELWELHKGTFRELRQRDQIAGTWWSRGDMDAHFDLHCKALDPIAMEPHRANFRKFALRRISYFIGEDTAFNNRVKRELRKWLKDHVNTAAKPATEDDSREFWDSVGRPADPEG
jgi:hypothetical protein